MDRPHIRLGRRLRGALRAAWLGRHGLGVVAETRNGLLLLDPRDYTVSKRLLREGEYDWPVVEALTAVLCARPGPLLVIGAHLGALLVPLARAATGAVAFEADPRNFRLLEANVRLNGLAGVRLENRAVLDRAGEVWIRRDPVNSGASHVAPAAGDRAGDAVPAAPLDACFDGELPAFSLAVMDAEGAESHILDGGARTFARCHALYSEISPLALVRQGRSLERLAAQLAALYHHAWDCRGGRPRRLDAPVERAVLAFASSRRVHDLLFTREPLPGG